VPVSWNMALSPLQIVPSIQAIVRLMFGGAVRSVVRMWWVSDWHTSVTISPTLIRGDEFTAVVRSVVVSTSYDNLGGTDDFRRARHLPNSRRS
jgi:hypothetical protein